MKNSQNRNNFAIFVRTVLNNPYILNRPTAKQAEFLIDNLQYEGFYGGAAGGGKSEALLMAALQYVEQPDYSALILRRTYADLSLPGALMDRTSEWLSGTDATWQDKSKTWKFPSGATLTFGYLEHEKDKYRYQGAEFQFVAYDELTQFTETQFQYLFSRVRKLKGTTIPLRIRAASNPGGIGHDWVKARFISPLKNELTLNDRFFIPALLEDNPFLDREAYCDALNKMDPVTREQLRNGNWDVSLSGGLFKREWFKPVSQIPQGAIQLRYWDLAATEPKKGTDPDYTTGVLMCMYEGIFYVKDVVRMRGPPGEVEAMVRHCAEVDGYGTKIVMEQEPGSSGIYAIDHFSRYILRGYNFIGDRVTGNKVVRAQPLSAAASNGNVKILENMPWSVGLLYELEQFPNVVHDDQVDGMSGAFNAINQMSTGDYAGDEEIPERVKSNMPSLSTTYDREIGSNSGLPGL